LSQQPDFHCFSVTHFVDLDLIGARSMHHISSVRGQTHKQSLYIALNVYCYSTPMLVSTSTQNLKWIPSYSCTAQMRLQLLSSAYMHVQIDTKRLMLIKNM